MKKKMGFIALFLVFILTGITIGITPIILKGYRMYQDAVTKRPIEQVILELKQSPSYCTLDQIAKSYTKGVIESEDKRFYSHGAIDPISIGRAVITNVKKGYFAEGGSTITQQLAKNLYFSFEKKLERKLAEIFVAIDLEKKYTKDEILEMYCNITYFGEGCYGIQVASLHYYQVKPKFLSNNQSHALVITLKSPNTLNPNAS